MAESSSISSIAKKPIIVTPGTLITQDTNFMRGLGTYSDENHYLRASVCGCVEKVNQLICVRGAKGRYQGEVGDVVIGRVIEIAQKKWKIDTYSKLDSILNLSSINLPGGVLRRRSEEDELLMREYFSEGELISAEVQQVHDNGGLSLHTRSLKYGKLRYGTLIRVPPHLVKRCKSHFHNLPCKASVLIGNNGWIWISPLLLETSGDILCHDENNRMEISEEERQTIARLSNCVRALTNHNVKLYIESIQCCYEDSTKFSILKELLKPEVEKIIIQRASALEDI